LTKKKNTLEVEVYNLFLFLFLFHCEEAEEEVKLHIFVQDWQAYDLAGEANPNIQ
jgi:hypothetical protein